MAPCTRDAKKMKNAPPSTAAVAYTGPPSPVSTGDKVRVTSARNVEGIVAYVMITKRLKPFVIAGKTHHMVGITWHFGYKGLVTGAIANDLTPFIGDPNTMIPEYKAFLVNVVKA